MVGGAEERGCQGITFGSDGYAYYLIVVMVSQVYTYVQFRWYTLNMCYLLQINYTSVRVLKIRNKTHYCFVHLTLIKAK